MAEQDQRFILCMQAIAERADRDAFAELFGHFAPRIKSYMLRLGADDASAEELAQEAMLTVWRRAASYDPAKAAVSTWVFTVARNKRIDGLRRAKRPDIDANDPTLYPEPERPDAAAFRSAEAAEVRAALEDLPPEQAEVIRLAYDAGLTQAEIAERLSAPLGTVKSRMRLALRRLKGALEE